MVCPSNNGGLSYHRRNSSSQNHKASDHSTYGHVSDEHECSGLDDQRISEVEARTRTIGTIHGMRSDRCQPRNEDLASQFGVAGKCPVTRSSQVMAPATFKYSFDH